MDLEIIKFIRNFALSQKVDVAIQQLVKLLKSPDTISEVIKIKPNLVSRESVKVLNR